MSGICGIFNLDGKPVAPEALEAMMQAISYWGPDGSGAWQAGPVGLGHLLLYNTPESMNEHLPRRDDAADLAITARARLDNREDLADALGIANPARASMPDSSLILKAYEKWGEDCPNRLLGDWCFAIWDGRNRKLFLARDHSGNSGLYYYQNAQSFIFASCLKGLLALPEMPRHFNEMRLAQVIINWYEEGQPSCYQDILRLPPAHAISVTSHRTRMFQYWDLEDTSPLRLNSDQEYLEAFREIFSQAVRCRLRSIRPVGLSLSGGLDSGSVAAMASRELQKEGRQLLAFSSVPLFNTEGLVARGRFGDETPFIEAIKRHSGNIKLTYIQAQGLTPLDGIRWGLSLHGEPGYFAPENYYWLVALLAEAQAQGIGTLLTGQGGNGTISWNHVGYLAGLARSGHWFTLLRELKVRKTNQQKPLWRIIAGQVIRPLLAPWLAYWQRHAIIDKERWEKNSAISLEFARRLSLKKLMYGSGLDPTVITMSKMRFAYLRYAGSIAGVLWHEAGAGFGLDVSDPTFDKRLIEFCLAIPDEQYSKDGLDRRLIRLAMREALPPQVRCNPYRGYQGADIGWRVRENWKEMDAALDQLEESAKVKNYLNIKKMRVTLQSIKNGVDKTNTQRCQDILLRGLTVGQFILREHESQPYKREPIKLEKRGG